MDIALHAVNDMQRVSNDELTPNSYLFNDSCSAGVAGIDIMNTVAGHKLPAAKFGT